MTDGVKKNRQAEREVAGMLKKWWSKVEPACEFCRSIPTGGWPGKDGEKIRTMYKPCGCLMTTAKKWPFVVSVRRRESLRLDLFFNVQKRQTVSPVWEWWRLAQDAASGQNSTAMMWLQKEKYREQQPDFPWLVMLPGSYWFTKAVKILPKADVQLGPIELWECDIDFGTDPPMLWFAERFLKANPRRLVGI